MFENRNTVDALEHQANLAQLRLLQREYEAMMAATRDSEEQGRLYDLLRDIVREIAELEKQ